MPKDTMTFVLDGNIFLSDFAKAIFNFEGLVDALATELKVKGKVEWSVDEIERSSARITVRGVSESSIGVEKVVEGYTKVGRAMQSNTPIPYSRNVRRFATGISEIIDGHVTSIRFETADSDIIIVRQARPIKAIPAAYGAIEGRIQTLSNRGSLRFTLFDDIYDRAVSCYLDESNEDLIREAWGRRATVEGLISRDPDTGRPLAIRRISDIQIIPDTFTSYRNARGAIRFSPDAPNPEDIIRRLRDG